MRFRWVAICLLLFLSACGEQQFPQVIPLPDQMTLYSLKGIEKSTDAAVEIERFHNSRVLGKLEITDLQQRQKIVAELNQGIAESDGSLAACFWPRHGLRIVTRGVTKEYLICFECLQFQTHELGAEPRTTTITATPQATLNAILMEAKIPLDQPH